MIYLCQSIEIDTSRHISKTIDKYTFSVYNICEGLK